MDNKSNHSSQYFIYNLRHKYYSNYKIIECACFEPIHYIINFDDFSSFKVFSESIIVDPAFLAIMRFPLKRRDSFFYLAIKKKKPFLENGLESPLIFVFILKGKTK